MLGPATDRRAAHQQVIVSRRVVNTARNGDAVGDLGYEAAYRSIKERDVVEGLSGDDPVVVSEPAGQASTS